MRTALKTLAAASVLIALAYAQDPSFSTSVEVVNLFASVRDKSGAVVSDLEKEDFVLKENGEERDIRYFSRQSDLPLTIGLLVDTSMSQAGVIEEQRRASYRFLDRVLQEKDQAFVISFDFDVELLQDLTSSKPLLEKALGRLDVPGQLRMRRRITANNQFPFPGGGVPFPRQRRGPYPGGSPYPGGGRGPGGGGGGPVHMSAGGTALYDAVFLAADEVLKNQAGRKALIVVSDGVDFGSKLSEDDAIQSVQRQDGILYSVYFSARQGGFGRRAPVRDGAHVLDQMSEQTGGRLYKLSGKTTLDQVFDDIEQELRNQYSIGFTPSPDAGPGFRHLELKTKKGGLKVSTRSGYYPAEEPKSD
ncbi:MAG: VWA domain-containing protein [Acidobacteria bacterium]|nr:VWA domain-containing protein [Acidobacteriota bacterium]